MRPSFFEQFPTLRDLTAYLKTRLETAGMSGTRYIAANLPKESAFQKDIMDAVKKWAKEGHIPESTFIWKHTAGVYQSNGLPDLMMVCGGKFIALEVKRPYVGTETALQEKVIDYINAAGGYAAIVIYPSEVKALLQKAGVWKGETNIRTACGRVPLSGRSNIMTQRKPYIYSPRMSTMTCQQCGKVFSYYWHGTGASRQYCDDCVRARRRAQQRAHYRENRERILAKFAESRKAHQRASIGDTVTDVCATCGKTFSYTFKGHKYRKYCEACSPRNKGGNYWRNHYQANRENILAKRKESALEAKRAIIQKYSIDT